MTTHRTGSYNYNTLCDVCGFKFKASELQMRWDGFMVCAADWEPRNILDFYRTRNDAHRLPFTRPDDASDESAISGFALKFQQGQTAVSPAIAPIIAAYPVTIEAMVMLMKTRAGQLITICRHLSGNLIFRVETTGAIGFYFMNPAGTPDFRSFTTTSTTFFSTNMPLNTWVRISCVATSNTAATFYMTRANTDGTPLQVSTSTVTVGSAGAYSGANSTFMVGTTVGFAEFPFDLIDDLRIWSIARSASDISTNWNTVLPSTSTGLVANFRFDEGYVNNSRSPTTVDSCLSTRILTVNGADFYPHLMSY